MRHSIFLLGAAAALAGCGQSHQSAASNDSEANSPAAEAPKPAYCFFKASETKDWKVQIDKAGDVVVSGKAYREDARYKALLLPATISRDKAEVSPTISQNDTGYAAPDNWWQVRETIPNSQGVGTVVVKCGADTVATLTVPRKK